MAEIPTYRVPPLTRLEVELRAVTAKSEPFRDAAEVAGPETRFFELGELGATVFSSSDADCALVADPVHQPGLFQ